MNRKAKAWLLGCSTPLVLLTLIAAALVLLGRGGVPSHSLLVLDLSGPIEEEVPASPLSRLLGGRPDTVLGLRTLLRAAAADPRVSALLVRVGGLEVGLAKADELREQIHRFQDSGKPAAAFIEFADTLDYYVASACRKVYVPPEGLLILRGVLADMPFLRGTLDKLRVQPDFVSIGRYKSAPEMFTRTDPSPAAREAADSILDQAYARLRDGIAESRGLAPERVDALINRSLFRGSSAVGAALADAAIYEDQVVESLQGAAKAELTRLAHRDYRRQARADQRGETIAVVFATGEIVPGQDGPFSTPPGRMDAEAVVEALRSVRADRRVRAVILRIDSPGGAVPPADRIWREMSLTREELPVVVSMSDVAASGGYWIATPASRVVAAPVTLTGSIGVFAGKFNLQGLYQWAGMRREILQRGENADLFSDYRAFSAAQRQLLQAESEATYRGFIARVAAGRGLDPAKAESAAQGRVWSGAQARERGLVDALGGFEQALEEARELAGLAPDAPVRLEFHPREKTLLESLASGELEVMGRSLRRLATLLDAVARRLDGQGGIEVLQEGFRLAP